MSIVSIAPIPAPDGHQLHLRAQGYGLEYHGSDTWGCVCRVQVGYRAVCIEFVHLEGEWGGVHTV